MCRSALVVAFLAVAVAGAPAPARAGDDPVGEAAAAAVRLAEEARHLGETARDVRDLLYYLSDPRGFQYDYYRASEQLTNDPVLGPLVDNLAALYRHRQWEAKVQGQAMVDSATPASVAVGAGLSWDAPLCRLFEAQGSVQGFYDDGKAQAAMAYGVGGCLPLPFDTFELGYRGRRDVRNSLLARPIALGERASGDTVYANLRFYRWLSADHQIDVAPMRFQFDWVHGGATTFQSWASIQPVYWARRGRGLGGRDQTFDFMKIAFTTLGLTSDGVDDPLVAAISPLAIGGVRLGEHVAIGLDAGFEIGEFHPPGVIEAVQRNALHLDATVQARHGGATLEVHAINGMYPTSANQILDEDRLTARLDVDRPAAWLRADGFVSHARLLSLTRYSERVWTYGAGVDGTLALTDHLFLYARAEGARNVVVDEDAAVPATVREPRVTAGVTAELRWPF